MSCSDRVFCLCFEFIRNTVHRLGNSTCDGSDGERLRVLAGPPKTGVNSVSETGKNYKFPITISPELLILLMTSAALKLVRQFP